VDYLGPDVPDPYYSKDFSGILIVLGEAIEPLISGPIPCDISSQIAVVELRHKVMIQARK
jgi:hypothetical protein